MLLESWEVAARRCPVAYPGVHGLPQERSRFRGDRSSAAHRRLDGDAASNRLGVCLASRAALLAMRRALHERGSETTLTADP